MGRWRYTLKAGEGLRRAIEVEDYDGIIDGLEACFTELNQAIPEDYDADELDNDLADIDGIRDTLNEGDDVDDEINYKLDELYDLCDALQIWVGGV